MNIYEKIQVIKKELLEANLKKTGENKFAGFKYYELSDIVPAIIELCNVHKVFTRISFSDYEAVLEVRNIENPEEVIYYTSPMEELELKGCNKVQALGGTETYSRRYLYMACFDIIENDMFDADVKVDEEYAKNYVFNFGKHKGKTLPEVIEKHDDYINWLLKNEDTDKIVLECIKVLTGRVPKEIDLDITKEFMELLTETGTDLDKLLSNYNKEGKEKFTTDDLTKEQMVEAIGIMKKKLGKENK